jgi:hypothetical protein
VNSADKTSLWKDIAGASMPVDALGVLADLRGRAEIRVALVGERAWICWRADSGDMLDLVARRILPVLGVELFTERNSEWYRLGEHLPAFGVPFRDGTTGMHLERIVIPGKLSVLRPGRDVSESLRICLVRDDRQMVRPATALLCALDVLSVWAEGATTAQLAALQGAWRQASDGEAGNGEVLVLGSTSVLPLLPGSVRYWGGGLLVPLGFRAEPALPEAAIRGVIGAGDGDLAVLSLDGLELIARESFKPLTRAGVRLGMGAPERSRPEGGGQP